MTRKVLAFVLFLLVCQVAVAQNYEQALQICERYYEDGDYQKALADCQKLLLRLRTQKQEHAAIVQLQVLEAKYLEAMGKYPEFEGAVRQALKDKKELFGENSTNYAKALLDVAQIYLDYSHVLQAENYLDTALKVLGTSVSEKGKINKNFPDNFFNAQILYLKTRIAYHKGLVQEFEQYIGAALAARNKQISKEESYFDEVKNNISTRKLTDVEYKRRLTEYAELLTMQADIYRIVGNEQKAQQQWLKAQEWIRDKFNSRELAAIRHQLVALQIRLDKGEDRKKLRKELDRLLFVAEQGITLVHKTYTQIHQVVLDYYIDNRFRTFKQQWEYEQNALKYYGKNTSHYAEAQRLDARDDFKNQAFTKNQDLDELEQNLKKVPAYHYQRVRWLRLLYNVALGIDDYQRALQYLTEMMSILEHIQGKDALEYLKAQMELANYLNTFTNRFDEVKSIYYEVFYGKLNQLLHQEQNDYLVFLNQLASYYEVVEKYDSTQHYLDKAVTIAQQKHGSDNIRYIIELSRLVRFEMSQGSYAQADSNINLILESFRAESNPNIYALENSQALETAANYYATMGLFDLAQENFRKAQRLFNKSNSSIANSSTTEDLAYLYIQSERFDKAESILLQALNIRKQRYGEENRFLIGIYNQLARLYIALGKYGEADTYINESLKISKKIFGNNSVKNVEGQLILGELYTNTGDYEKAIQEINESIKIQKEHFGEKHLQIANSFAQLALVQFYNKGKTEEIEKLFLNAQNIILEKLGDKNPIYANGLKNLALFYTENNRLNEAQKLLQEADQIWINTFKSNRSTNSAEIAMLLGNIELKKNNFENAKNYYFASLKILGKILTKNHPKYVENLSRIARMYYVQKDLNKAEEYAEQVMLKHKSYISTFFPALSDREKIKYWSTIRNDFEFYNTLMVRLSAKKPESIGKILDNALLTKSLQLNSSINKIRKLIRDSKDQELLDNYQKWIQRKQDLKKALAMNPEQLKEEKINPKEISKEIDFLEKVLSRKSTAFGQSSYQKDWTQIKAQLKAKEVAVEIIRYRHFDKSFTDSIIYAALIIFPNKNTPEFVPIAEGKLLEGTYLKQYQNRLGYGLPDLTSYKRYWENVDKKIPEGYKIYLAATGVYNQINLEPMQLPDKSYLIDRREIILLGTTEDLLERQERKKSQAASSEILLVGNPIFYKNLREDEYIKSDRKVPQLAGTQQEIEVIEKILSTESNQLLTCMNNYATEDTLRKVKSPFIFHVATHGFFEPDQDEQSDSELAQKTINNPLLRSGILLKNAGDLMDEGNVYSYNKEDGILTAFEATDLNLDGTKLVVLSACETGKSGLNEGDGVSGLQRAFLAAGAETLMMSLLKVDDSGTRKLMEIFYQKWKEKGIEKGSKHLAFLEAKKAIREIPEFAAAKFWSSFVMLGLD